MKRNSCANEEFDTAEIFRKLISKNEEQTLLGMTQNFFAELERNTVFVRDLGELCLKYGIGGISELEYHKDASSAYVIINYTYGKYRLVVRRSDDIITIIRSIFAVVASATR